MSQYDLPLELWLQVFSHLDVEPPSAQDALEIPDVHSLSREDKPLKNLSLVCKAVRTAVIPLLYKHARVKLEDLLPASMEKEDASDRFYKFIRSTGISLPSISLLIYAEHELLNNLDRRFGKLWILWARLLSELDISHLIIIAPPVTLGVLCNESKPPASSSFFEMKFQRIELKHTTLAAQKLHNARSPSSMDSLGLASLLRIKGFDNMSYHGGVCLPIYGMYHYFEKDPPCLLRRWLSSSREEWRTDSRIYSNITDGNIKSFTYVCVFPHYVHFETTVLKVLHERFSAVQHLTLQLTPSTRSNILDDTAAINTGNVRLRDCWTEVERCYTSLFRMVLRGSYNDKDKFPNLETLTLYDCRKGAFGMEIEECMNAACEFQRRDQFTWEKKAEASSVEILS